MKAGNLLLLSLGLIIFSFTSCSNQKGTLSEKGESLSGIQHKKVLGAGTADFRIFWETEFSVASQGKSVFEHIIPYTDQSTGLMINCAPASYPLLVYTPEIEDFTDQFPHYLEIKFQKPLCKDDVQEVKTSELFEGNCSYIFGNQHFLENKYIRNQEISQMKDTQGMDKMIKDLDQKISAVVYDQDHQLCFAFGFVNGKWKLLALDLQPLYQEIS